LEVEQVEPVRKLVSTICRVSLNQDPE